MDKVYLTEQSRARTPGFFNRLKGDRAALGDPIRIALALLAVYLIWGSTYLGLQVALEGFPPFLLLGIRFMLAGGALYLWLRMRGAPAPSRPQWKGGALLGLFLLVGGNGGVTVAEQWVASGL